MFGGHALFTISDKTFDRMVEANNSATQQTSSAVQQLEQLSNSLEVAVASFRA